MKKKNLYVHYSINVQNYSNSSKLIFAISKLFLASGGTNQPRRTFGLAKIFSSNINVTLAEERLSIVDIDANCLIKQCA